MKINWKVRIKNKTWLAAMLAMIVTFIYNLLAMLDVAPAITQDATMQVINTALMVLSALGVIVDPTTAGVGDSERALHYTAPYTETDAPSHG